MTHKRTLSFILTLALLLTSCPVFAFAEDAAASSTQTQIPGDCNADGKINMKDVLLLRQYLAELKTFEEAFADHDNCVDERTLTLGGRLVRADANGDDKVNMKDVLLERKFLADYDVEFAAHCCVPPTTEPTTEPTTVPTTVPTTEPTTVPTTEPTTEPTTVPTTEPTTAPTTAPTEPQPVYYTVSVTLGSADKGQAEQGEVVTVTADAAAEGFLFDKWVVKEGGVVLADATAAETTFTMGAANVVVEATYKLGRYQVTVENGTVGGQTTAMADIHSTVTVVADAAPAGYVFDQWTTESGVTFADASAETTTFTMPEKPVTVTASYVKKELTVTVEGGTASPAGSVYVGDTITLTAAVPEGYTFTEWTTADAGVSFADKTSACTTFAMPGNSVKVVATFTAIDYTVTVTGGTADKTTAHVGDVITLTPTTPEGYTFTGWSSDQVTVPTNGKFTMPAENVTVTANFDANAYNIEIKGGTADKAAAKAGDTVTITANEIASPYVFDSWNVLVGGDIVFGDKTAASTTFVMPEHDVTIEAVTRKDGYVVAVDGGSSDCANGRANEGVLVTLTADEPEIGKVFSNWEVKTEDLELSSLTSSVASFTMPAKDIAVKAVFVDEKYSVTVNGGNTGKSSTNYGDSVTISAQPKTGKNFVKWVVDSENVTLADETAATATFTMPADNVTFTAVYSYTDYTLSVLNGEFVGETPTSTDTATNYYTVNVDDTITLTADAAAEGFLFDKWVVKAGGLMLTESSNETVTFTMLAEDTTVEATYKEKTYGITVTNGTCKSGSAAAAGRTVNVVAYAAEDVGDNLEFYYWEGTDESGNALTFADAESEDTTFVMPASAVSVTAVYGPKRYAVGIDSKASANYTRAAAGTLVTIKADNLPTGMYFTNWIDKIGNITDLNTTEAETTFTMPAQDISIQTAADYIKYNISITGGHGQKEQAILGESLWIKADVPAGKTFQCWTGNVTFADATSANTTFTMGAEDAVIIANYDTVLYPVTVTGGTADSDTYEAGATVIVTADTPEEGYMFTGWTTTTDGVTFLNAYAAETSFTMPASAVSVTATFDLIPPETYSISVEGGTATPSETSAGTSVSITADAAEAGYEFDCWSTTTDGVSFADANASTTTFTMVEGAVSVKANYKKSDLTVTVSNGTASVGGVTAATAQIGDVVTLTADTAALGYEFEKWTVTAGGVTLADTTNATTTFTMGSANVKVEATYKIKKYTVTVVNGTLKGSGGVTSEQFQAGTSVGLQADTAPEEKVFDKWVVTEDAVVIENPTSSGGATFTMPNGNVTVTATYKDKTYTVAVNGGSADCGTAAAKGTVVTVTAEDKSASGQAFNTWGDISGVTLTAEQKTATTFTFTMPGNDVSFRAYFTTLKFDVTVTDGTASKASAAYGETITVTADTKEGYTFTGWTGGVTFADSTAAETTFTMPASDVSVKANYTANEYTLTLTNCSAEPEKVTYHMGDEITLTAAAPETGKVFDKWVVTPSTVVVSGGKFTMPASDVTVEAAYKNAAYTVTVENGSATPAGGAYGDTIEITADTPAAGYVFDKWTTEDGVSFDDAASATTTFTLPAKNVTVKATYKKADYTVSVLNGTATPSTAQMGDVIHLVADAAADDGMEFDKWVLKTDDVEVTLEDETATNTTFTMPAGDVELEATYKYISFTVTVTNGTATVNGNPAATAKTIDTVSITANTPETGWEFTGWTSADGVSFADAAAATTSFDMIAKNVTVVANYAKISYTVTVTGGTASAATAQIGDSVTLTVGAVPAGRTFDSWNVTAGGVTVTDNAFTMGSANVVIEAVYGYKELTVSAENATVSPAGTVHVNDTITVTAEVPEGYTFKEWQGEGVSFGDATAATTTFTMPGNNVSIKAVLEAIDYAVTVNGGTAYVDDVEVTVANVGDVVTIVSDAPETGKAFDSWTVVTAGVTLEQDSSAATTFVMPAKAVEFTATYKTVDHTITVIGDANGKGRANTTGASYNDVITLTAEPNEGYELDAWTSADVTITDGKFTMPAKDVIIYATYKKATYTVTATDATVSVNGGEAAASATAQMGDTVTLTANEAETGYEFVSFSVNGEAITGDSFVMSAENTTVTVNYKKTDYAVTVIGGSADKTTANMGDTVTLTAGAAPEGQKFLKWTVNGADITGSSFTMPAANVTAEAVFTAVDYALTVTKGSATVGGNAAATAQMNDTVTITADAPETGYLFDKWTTTDGVSFDDATSATTTFVMPAKAVTVVATYKKDTYSVTVTKGTADPTSAQMGDRVEISADTPETGYIFDAWTTTTEGVTFANENSADTSFTMPAGNVSVTATYKKIDYTVTVNGGTADKTTANIGDTITLTPDTAPTGKQFTGWTVNKGGVTVTENAFTMPAANVEVTANYEWVDVTVTVTGGTASDGTESGASITTHYGASVTLTAAAAPTGKIFQAWNVTAGGVTVSDNAFTMGTENVTVEAVFADVDYTVTVNGGTADKAAANMGDTVTVTAAAAETGYVFDKWTSTDVTFADATAAETTFTMPAKNVKVTATYKKASLAVTVINGSATVNGEAAATAQLGDVVTVTADTPAAGYAFDKWTSSDVVLTDAASAETTFTMPAKAVAVTATYKKINYTVTVTGGTASKTTANIGDVITVTVTPKEGYTFTGWTGDVTFTDAEAEETTFTMPASDVTVKANFEAVDYTVTVNGGTANVSTANVGDEITLTADTKEGYTFTAWSSADVTVSGNKFTMPASDVTVTATYTAIDYTVTVTDGTTSKSTANIGDTITLTADTKEGYTFTGWTMTPSTVTVTDNIFTMPAANVTAKANYIANDYTVTVIGGTASKTVANIGDVITLTADAKEGYLFSGWSSADVTVSGNKFTMPASDVTVTAEYEAIDYTVTVTGGTADKTTAHVGDVITLTPTTPEGYTFTGWTSSDVTVTDNQFIMPASDVTVTAELEAIDYTVTVTGGTADKTTANIGDVITLTATVPTGKVFDKWTVTAGGVTITGNSFTMGAADVVIEASFTDADYTVTVNGGAATPSGGSMGTEITVTANTAEVGYEFDRWVINAGDVTLDSVTAASTTFTMPAEDVELTATYKLKDYTVSVTLGTATPSTANIGETVTLTADAPADGLAFDKWVVKTEGVTLEDETAENTTFTMPAKDVEVEATYKIATYTVTVNNGQADVTEAAPGTTVQLTADMPEEGKMFDAWIVNAGGVTLDDIYSEIATFIMPSADVEVTATYKNIEYTVSVTDGTASAENAAAGTSITVTANEPETGMVFDGWIVSGVTLTAEQLASATVTFTMPASNVSLIATYAEDLVYTVTVTNGTVNGKASDDVEAGTAVTVIAAEAPDGEVFSGWTVTGVTLTAEQLASATVTFTMPASDVTLKANYAADTHTVTVHYGQADVTEALEGASIQLTADMPESGMVFDHWQIDSANVTLSDVNSEIATFTMPDEDVEVTAVYVTATYTVTVDGGTVNGALSATFAAGESVTVIANAAEDGYVFDFWNAGGVTLDSTTTATVTFTMPSNDVALVASFCEAPAVKYTVTVTLGSTDKSTAAAGETVTITADTAAEGYAFKCWTVISGAVTVANLYAAETTFVMPSSDVEIEATYQLASTAKSITVVNGQADVETAEEGDTVTLTADVPASGFEFDKWVVKAGDVTLDDSNSELASFTMGDADVEVEATYKALTYTVYVTDGKANGVGTLIAATNSSVTAVADTPESGYVFDYWYAEGVTLADSTASTVTFTMPANNVTLIAMFAEEGGSETSEEESSTTESSATESSSAEESSTTESSATESSIPENAVKIQMNFTEYKSKYSDVQTRTDVFYAEEGQPVTMVFSYEVWHADSAVETAAGWFDLYADGEAITPVITSASNTYLYATYTLPAATADITITGEVSRYATSSKLEDFEEVTITINGNGGTQSETSEEESSTDTSETSTGETYSAPLFLTDEEADTVIDRVTLSFYDKDSTQYGITFHSYETLTDPVVQYVEGDEATPTEFASPSSVDATTELFDDFMTYNYDPTDFSFTASYDDRNNCNGNMPETNDYTHKAALPVLSYNTTYSYRVGGQNADGEQVWSDIYSFTTRAADPGSDFSFIWMSDSQYSPYQTGIHSRMKNVLDAALSLCPNPDMMVHGGDFSDAGSYLWTYAAEVTGNEDFFSKYPLMCASGNHDTTGTSEIYRLINVDLTGTGRNSSQSTSTGTYYSYDYGDAHFTCLNISKDASIDATQLAWVQSDLASTDKEWRFVYFHRPIYTCFRDSDDGTVDEDIVLLREQLAPLFYQYDVDVVMQAHVHMYSRTKPITDENGTVATGWTTQTTNGYEYIVNPGAPIYTDVATAASETEHIYREAKSFDEQPSFLASAQSGQANSFAIFTVSGNTLSVDACYASETGTVSYYEKFGIINNAS